VKRLLAAGLLLLTTLAQAGPSAVQVQGVRLWAAPDNTRVVFDTSAAAEHRLFVLSSPDRLVIDLKGARLAPDFKKRLQAAGLVKGLRTAPRNKTDLRVVLDLKRPVKPRSFVLKPNDQYGHRLVIDLHDSKLAAASRKPKPRKQARPSARDLVIAIDAGHGGDDPGARGKRGVREKDVVLGIARRLAKLVEKEPGMKPVLVRTGDYYIGLRKRIDKARRHRADLFISIHADAFRDRRVHGSSVYVLSQRGASSEMARWLAARENAADLVGGVSLDDKDDLLAEVLLDLAQSATIETSQGVASNVLRELRKIGKVHKRHVQHAGFVVLKSPDIPSLLVETAFISNPSEEKRLRSAAHQQKVARAIMNGIRRYYRANPPAGTRLALARAQTETTQRHVIRRGDTLSHIAKRYGVSMRSLRSANRLRGDRLLVGKVLTIPGRDS